MTQICAAYQSLFISIRTLEYLRYGDAGFFGEASDDDEELDLDWDFVPIMLNYTLNYLIVDVNVYFIFDAGRELNTKVFNEFIKLRGKATTKNPH